MIREKIQPRMLTVGKIRDQILEKGFYGPLPVLSKDESLQFLKTVRNPSERPPLDWIKGYACTSRAFYEISTRPAILDVVTSLIGNDVLLWGASLTSQPPGSFHPWHCDIETSAGSGKSVSVWIGLDNTERNSSMLLIPYSHRFGVTIQETRNRFKRRREETTNDEILAWAREYDPRCSLLKPHVHNGEALFFDGNLWHGTHNLTERTRWALLLQYATPGTKIRIPDPNQFDWPFQFIPLPKPPCILITGSDEVGINRIVPPPSGPRNGWLPQLTSRVHSLQIPLPVDETKAWKPYPIFHGSTPNLQFLSCHASVLSPGESPHPPHTHDDEEILMLLSGEVDLLLPNLQSGNSSGETPRKRLKPGEVVYYPHDFPHTLETVSKDPANYLMLKWTNEFMNPVSPLAHTHSSLLDFSGEIVEKGFHPRLIFEGSTRRLQKLHCHASTLTPGAGYDPHADAHDVVILVLEGEVETLGERVKPYGVIFYPAGELHGMKNPGDIAAKYVVFEFHSRQEFRMRSVSGEFAAAPASNRSLLSKIVDPQCYIRTYKTVAWNINKMRNR